MEKTDIESITNKRISVSRNHPSAFVVGAGNFVASALIEKLLDSKTQVLAFDVLSNVTRDNLSDAFKCKYFYFLETPEEGFSSQVLDVLDGDLPSVGYGFFFVNDGTSAKDLTGFINLAVKFAKSGDDSRRLKCVFVSDIGLYKKELSRELKKVKSLEVMFAKAVADKGLNGRVVRLAAVYGPKMSWDQNDPMIKMLRAALLDNLREGGVSDEFGSRAIFIDRAVELILKSMLTGSTAMKIYDGALVHPVKVAEIRQILMNVDWSIDHDMAISKSPPWLTPNLEKTIRELNWSPESDVLLTIKKTIDYFKKHPGWVQESGNEEVAMPTSQRGERAVEEKTSIRAISGKSFWEGEPSVAKAVAGEGVRVKGGDGVKRDGRWGSRLGYLLLIALVGYGLVFPVVMFGIGFGQIGWNLSSSKEALGNGDYNLAIEKSQRAVDAVSSLRSGFSTFSLIGQAGILTGQIETISNLIESIDSAVVAIRDANEGFMSLSRVSAVISGEEKGEPAKIYSEANLKLRSARESLTKVDLDLKHIQSSGFFGLLSSQIENLRAMVLEYNLSVSKGEMASTILPRMTGVDGTAKSYLIILQNNKSLRAGGGAIEAVAQIDFENGKLKNIESRSSGELDGLASPLAAPADIHLDFGATSWSIRDSSNEPDFGALSRVVQLLYQRDTSKKVDGVIGVDLSAFSGLAVGLKGISSSDGIVITDGKIDKSFFDKVADSKIYGQLLGELLKKMFFLEKVNWAEIGSVIDEGLRYRDIQIYSDDKSSYAYLTSQNWAGIMPRQSELVVGEDRDFLSVNDTVIATGSANIELSKKISLERLIGEDLGDSHKLTISYLPKNINSNVSMIKSRVRVYVPGGNKLDRVALNGIDVTKSFKTSSDYGRINFSGLVDLGIDQESKLVVDYSAGVVKLDNGRLDYRLDVVKQAGSGVSDFEWKLTFPEGWKVGKLPSRAISSKSEVSMSDSLNADLTITVSIQK